MDTRDFWRPAFAEFLGTMTLVFIGAGSIVTLSRFFPPIGGVNQGGSLVGIALAHGLAIAVMVTALGHISGGHFNPAITLAALFSRRIKGYLAASYIAFQMLGGIVGAVLLMACLPSDWWNNPGVAMGTPQLATSVSAARGLLVEAILTFFLVLVVFGAGMDSRNRGGLVAGLAIGFTVSMDILMGGPVTGAAMNPARWFGPALLSSTWDNPIVYLSGPLLGGIIAGVVYDLVFHEPQRKPEPSEAPPTAPAEGVAKSPPV